MCRNPECSFDGEWAGGFSIIKKTWPWPWPLSDLFNQDMGLHLDDITMWSLNTLMSIRPLSCSGEGRYCALVSMLSWKSLSPRMSLRYRAMACCCLVLQWFSSDRISGYLQINRHTIEITTNTWCSVPYTKWAAHWQQNMRVFNTEEKCQFCDIDQSSMIKWLW